MSAHYAKLVFARTGGLGLTINRRGNTVVAYLAEAGAHSPMLSFGTAAADRCYIAEEECERRSLCIGQHSSFHLSAEEAEIVRDRLGIRCTSFGDDTSFESSSSDFLRGVLKDQGDALVAGASLERRAAA